MKRNKIQVFGTEDEQKRKKKGTEFCFGWMFEVSIWILGTQKIKKEIKKKRQKIQNIYNKTKTKSLQKYFVFSFDEIIFGNIPAGLCTINKETDK